MNTDVQSDKELTHDWAAIGRRVRQRTLEAVSAHFAMLGETELPRPSGEQHMDALVETDGRS
jgi:hypothetical protein